MTFQQFPLAPSPPHDYYDPLPVHSARYNVQEMSPHNHSPLNKHTPVTCNSPISKQTPVTCNSPLNKHIPVHNHSPISKQTPVSSQSPLHRQSPERNTAAVLVFVCIFYILTTNTIKQQMVDTWNKYHKKATTFLLSGNPGGLILYFIYGTISIFCKIHIFGF